MWARLDVMRRNWAYQGDPTNFSILSNLVIADQVDLTHPVFLEFKTLGPRDRYYVTRIDLRKDGSVISPLGPPIGSRLAQRVVFQRIFKNEWFYIPGFVQGSLGYFNPRETNTVDIKVKYINSFGEQVILPGFLGGGSVDYRRSIGSEAAHPADEFSLGVAELLSETGHLKLKTKSEAISQAKKNLCEDNRKLLFQCTIKKNNKIVQMCLGKKNTLFYKIGKDLSKPELALRRDRKEYDINLGGAYAGFKEHSIQYSNDGYDFELSLNIDEAGDASDDTGELYVSKNDKLLATLECQPETMKYGKKSATRKGHFFKI